MPESPYIQQAIATKNAQETATSNKIAAAKFAKQMQEKKFAEYLTNMHYSLGV